MMWYVIIPLVVLVLIALWAVGVYNRLIRLKNQIKNAWSQIDVQLQRRYDLIPNLVETVKGYMAHEKNTLEAVINARNVAMAAKKSIKSAGGPTEESIKELVGAEKTLSGALGNIFALAENYPQLRASENMARLQEELSTTENKIAFARQSYNDQVLLYNTAQETFPTVLLAKNFGHHPAELYEVSEEQAKSSVKISFDR